MKIEVISVNYNTPDLIERMIKSIREHEGDIPIRIIDGSDQRELVLETFRIENEFTNVTFQRQGWNIHHGRGMDMAMTTSHYDACFIIDSDNFLLKPMIEKMKEVKKKIVGWYCYENDRGFGNARHPDKEHYIKYFHPSLMLMDVAFYLDLKKKKAGFIHHGSPCIQMMKYLHDTGDADKYCADIFEIMGVNIKQIGDWCNLDNSKGQATRGTVNRWGRNY